MLIPVNRHLLIEQATQPERDFSPAILLPEVYTPNESEYVKVKILDWAKDVALSGIESYEFAIVNRTMIQEVDDGERTHSIVLENYVVGFIGASSGK